MTQEERRIIVDLRTRMEHNLKTCILPFWTRYMTDQVHGGFYGRVDGSLQPDLSSPKSMVLNGRMLWTYSRAWDMVRYPACQELAQRAFRYIQSHFWDELYGGVYWAVTCRGEPSELEKRTYAQAFLIYSYAEYYRVFGSKEALDRARQVLSLLNRHMKYPQGGYADSAARDWLRDDWINFWVKNRTGAAKLLNSNMHLFEAIYNLAQAAPEPWILQSLRDELEFLLGTVVDRKLHHLKAAMDVSGARLDHEINYGHDAECSYLLTGAAELLGDADLIRRARETAVDLMDHVLAEGMDPEYGGLYYIGDSASGEINRAKIWWVQAEGITASFNCYQFTGDRRYLDAAVNIWNYVERDVVNHDLGEWYSVGLPPCDDTELRAQADQLKEVFNNNELAGKGKCPYHNSRTCFEIMRRADVILSPAGACP